MQHLPDCIKPCQRHFLISSNHNKHLMYFFMHDLLVLQTAICKTTPPLAAHLFEPSASLHTFEFDRTKFTNSEETTGL